MVFLVPDQAAISVPKNETPKSHDTHFPDTLAKSRNPAAAATVAAAATQWSAPTAAECLLRGRRKRTAEAEAQPSCLGPDSIEEKILAKILEKILVNPDENTGENPGDSTMKKCPILYCHSIPDSIDQKRLL